MRTRNGVAGGGAGNPSADGMQTRRASPFLRTASERRLLRAYREHGDQAARTSVVERNLPLVHLVARRYAQRAEQVEELVQVGCIGLVKAIDRFDPARGSELRTYALPTIEGEVRHYLRDHAALQRVPVAVRELRRVLLRRSEELAQALGRSPSVRELAHAAGVDEASAAEALGAGLPLPLRPGSEPPAPDEHEASERRAVLTEALGALDQIERRVVYRRFFEDLTQARIALELGISQAHVSRLLRRAIAKLRAQLASPEPPAG